MLKVRMEAETMETETVEVETSEERNLTW